MSAAAGAVAAETNWIIDETTGCGTSNEFPSPDERIRWYGQCVGGRLYGHGTLIWYRRGVEVERNEGSFLNGEFHGEVVTTYPDGQAVVGQYRNGQRDGNFVVIKSDGSHIRATYERGRLTSQTKMTPRDVELWRQQRAALVAANSPADASSAYAAAAAAASPQGAPSTPAVSPPGQTVSPAAPAVEPTPAPPATAVAQAQPAPSPSLSVRPAEMVAYDDGVDAEQLFRSLFASSGASAVPPPAVETQVAYWTNANHATDAPTETYAAYVTTETSSPSAAPALRSSPSPTYALLPPTLTTTVIESYQRPELHPPPAGSGGLGSLPTIYVNPPPRLGESTGESAFESAFVLPGAMQPNSTEAADTLFAQGYRLERAGRFYEAEQAYTQVLLRHPSAPSALLANARLNDLKRDARERSVQVVGAEAASGSGGAAAVVGVNSPVPQPSQTSVGMLPVYDHGMVSNSPVLYHTVCSLEGLYEDDSGWCGVVTRDENRHYLVEVREVHLGGFGTIGITRSTCTGNVFLTWFSRGATIRVPKPCVSVVR